MALIVSNSCCSLPISPSVRSSHAGAGVTPARVGQRRLHRRNHLGAAARLQRGDKRLGLADVLGIGGHGVGKQHGHGVIETDDVEAVGRL
jgi:hypothetical protein